MSRPVDVLAVMDAWIGNGKPQRLVHAELVQARAAVAELIEANIGEYAAQKAYDFAATGKPRNDAWGALIIARDRRRVALANVGGAE